MTLIDRHQSISNRRAALLLIDPQVFVEMFKHPDARYRLKITAGALPDDAQFNGMNFDPMRGAWVLCIKSNTFDEVPPELMPPELPPVTVYRIFDDDLEAAKEKA